MLSNIRMDRIKNQSLRLVDIQQVIIISGLDRQEANHLKKLQGKVHRWTCACSGAQYENLH